MRSLTLLSYALTLANSDSKRASLLFVLISGIVIARLKGKNRKNAIYVHIALSIFTLIFIFFHISEHLILG